jgi:hypothetical protein
MPSSSDQNPPKERSAFDLNPYYQEEFSKARLAGDKSKNSRRSRGKDWHEGENVNKERASRSVPKEL